MAGARAAITLRNEGIRRPGVLIGSEPDAPYERPPLSKGFLRGEQQPAELTIRPKAQDWQDIGVELRTGTDRDSPSTGAARALELADGTRIGYDRLLLATGSEPRRLDLPGSDRRWPCCCCGPARTPTGSGGAIAAARADRGHRRWLDRCRGGGVRAASWAREVTLLTGPLAVASAARSARRSRPSTRISIDATGVDLRQGARRVAIEGDGGTGHGRPDGATAHVTAATVVVVGIGAMPRIGLAAGCGPDRGRRCPGGPPVPDERRAHLGRGRHRGHAPPRAPPRRAARTTGRPPGSGVLPPPSRCSTRAHRMSGCRTCTATSSTCRWRRGACHRAGIGWSSDEPVAMGSWLRGWLAGVVVGTMLGNAPRRAQATRGARAHADPRSMRTASPMRRYRWSPSSRPADASRARGSPGASGHGRGQGWRAWRDSNSRPSAPEADALSAELQAHATASVVVSARNVKRPRAPAYRRGTMSGRPVRGCGSTSTAWW